MTFCTVSAPWWSTMPLSSAAIQTCSEMSLSTRKPFCCARTKRCISVTSDRNPSSGGCSERQWRASAYSRSAIDGVRCAKGENVRGEDGRCSPVIARLHRQGAQRWRRWPVLRKTAEQDDAVEYVRRLWQSQWALRALLKLR